MSAGLATGDDRAEVIREAVQEAATGLDGRSCDLVLFSFSPHFVEHARELSDVMGSELSPGTMIGVSAGSVLGGVTELEQLPGVSVLAASLPGVQITTFTADDLPVPTEDGFAEAAGIAGKHRGTLLFTDAFSVPLVRLLPAVSKAIRRVNGGPLLGGVASAGDSPGGNALVCNGSVRRDGLVGVSLAGRIHVDPVVSQGCRPIGPNLVVTAAKANLVRELGGRPAHRVMADLIASLEDDERRSITGGLFVGLVVDEYKERFGRGDYLMRPIVAADEDSGSIAVGDQVRTGQTVRLHVRDRATADEDLSLLLDAQKIHDRPLGVWAVSCNGRGTALFGSPHHDARAIARAFAPPRSGADLALGGTPMGAEVPSVPMAGFFGAGEIGPVGGASYLHAHTASLAIFRGP